jgi:transcriptional regulator with XRE-family HTH domain
MAGNEPFASRLREARLRKGARLKAAGMKGRYSQEMVAINIGVAEESASSRINHYEQGRHLPDLETAKRLAKELEVPLAYLFCEDNVVAEILLALERIPARKKKLVLSTAEDLSVEAGKP